jgi:hypothetical protein
MILISDEGFGRDCGKLIPCGAEGECGNSQAKGPGLDDTLESDVAPTKQRPVQLAGRNLSGKPTEAYC